MRNDSTKRRYMSAPDIFGLRGWLVRNFDDAAQNHDYHYETQDISKWRADYILLKDMQRMIKKEHYSGRKKVGYYLVAYTVYIVLTLFGWVSWFKNKKELNK